MHLTLDDILTIVYFCRSTQLTRVNNCKGCKVLHLNSLWNGLTDVFTDFQLSGGRWFEMQISSHESIMTTWDIEGGEGGEGGRCHCVNSIGRALSRRQLSPTTTIHSQRQNTITEWKQSNPTYATTLNLDSVTVEAVQRYMLLLLGSTRYDSRNSRVSSSWLRHCHNIS